MNLKATPTCGVEARDQMMERDTARVVQVRRDTTETALINNPLFFFIESLRVYHTSKKWLVVIFLTA